MTGGSRRRREERGGGGVFHYKKKLVLDLWPAVTVYTVYKEKL